MCETRPVPLKSFSSKGQEPWTHILKRKENYCPGCSRERSAPKGVGVRVDRHQRHK